MSRSFILKMQSDLVACQYTICFCAKTIGQTSQTRPVFIAIVVENEASAVLFIKFLQCLSPRMKIIDSL